MTIHVSVFNKDTRETAVISVKQVSPENVEQKSTDLKGGEGTEVYVHSGCKLIIEEVEAP